MSRRHFETGGAGYDRFRPTYPKSLSGELADLAPGRMRAVDVGCGTGQLSVMLADQFDAVSAFDVSTDQLRHATPHPKVTYALAAAEALPVDDTSAALVTAAQAAHWFDLPPFYAEVRRIAVPGAILALITYGIPVVEGPAAARFEQLYWNDVYRYWPPERALIENEYRDLPFPFDELVPPELDIVCDWNADELIGYVETWSASKRARADGRGDILDVFAGELRRLYGDARYRVTWPVRMRLGRV